MGIGVLIILKKMRGVHFSPKNGEVGKIKVVEEGCSGQGTYE